MDSSPLPEEGIDVDTNATSQDAADDSSTPIPEELTKKKRKGPAKKKRKGPAKEKTKEERERSRVWEHFTRIKDNENFCKCHYCEKTLSCPTTSGTSNLGKHLLICKQYEAFQKGNTQQVMRGDGSLQAGKVPESVVREATNEMIVLGELPFSFVESIAWRHFCSKVNLPNPISRRTSTRDIYEMYVERKATMKKWFSATKQRVSLTTDIWVAQATGASFMVITLHFIDADWHLRKLVIGFKYVIDHKGATIASVLLDCLTEWGVEKIFTITVDNATANTNALSKFHREFKKKGRDAFVLDGEFMHMRCCAHIINLIVKDGLRQVNENVDAIRNAVTYVRSSTKRMVSFDQRVDAAKICRGSLPLDVKTRWNSTHLMLSKAQKFRLAFDKMAAEDKLYNDYFLEVDNGKKRIGPPKFTDWVGIERLVTFLGLFYTSTLVVSASKSVNSYKCYGEIVTIQKNLMTLSCSPDKEMRSKAAEMREKFDKYWDGLGEINKLLIVASVFDPTKKFQFAQLCFDKLYGQGSVAAEKMFDSVLKVLGCLFNEYARFFPKQSSNAVSQCGGSESTASQHHVSTFEEEDMDSTGQGFQYERMEFVYNEMLDEEGGVDDLRDELDLYLKEPVEKPKNLLGTEYDVLGWWKRNSCKFPILSELARDVLAMQVSSVASESAFSTSGRIVDSSRSSLSNYSIEVLMCTEQWMKEEIQLKEKGALTNAQLLADIELQDNLQKEFEACSLTD